MNRLAPYLVAVAGMMPMSSTNHLLAVALKI